MTRSELIAYDLQTDTVLHVLKGFVTPRNIIFAPSGDVFYVSDSSLGIVTKIDSHSFQMLSHLCVGPGAFGTAISKDGTTLFINNQAANTPDADLELARNRLKEIDHEK